MRQRLALNVSIAAALLITLLAAPTSSGARALPQAPQAARRLRALVVVFDGLRPDHVTAARMPTLFALGQRGVVSSAHHSIYPTVTRVNTSALVTGTGPNGHGVLDNTIYLPRVDSSRTLNTGDAADMRLADSVLSGNLLTTATLPDILRRRNARVVVASAGSSGSAYLLAGAGRAITLNADLTLPPSLEPMVTSVLGAPAPDASPNLGLNARAVDALLRIGVDSLNADVGFVWLSDPDHTAHGAGLGSIMADSSIRAADRELARLLAGLHARGLTDMVDVFVVSDHGFSSHAGRNAPISSVLASLKDQVRVAGSAVYVLRGGDSTRAAVVRALQAAPSVGAIFTSSSRGDHGIEPGTLAFRSIGWDHARAGAVLYSANWSHERNAAGIEGTTAQGGVAGHGTTSPYDIVATLVAAGPHVRRGAQTGVPSSNADIAPTLLRLLGAPIPASMTGRVLTELLVDGPAIATVRIEHDSVVAERARAGASYRTTLYRSRVGRTRYVDSTVTKR